MRCLELQSELRPLEPPRWWYEEPEPEQVTWWHFAQAGPDPYEDCVNTEAQAQELLAEYIAMGTPFTVSRREVADWE